MNSLPLNLTSQPVQLSSSTVHLTSQPVHLSTDITAENGLSYQVSSQNGTTYCTLEQVSSLSKHTGLSTVNNTLLTTFNFYNSMESLKDKL